LILRSPSGAVASATDL